MFVAADPQERSDSGNNVNRKIIYVSHSKYSSCNNERFTRRKRERDKTTHWRQGCSFLFVIAKPPTIPKAASGMCHIWKTTPSARMGSVLKTHRKASLRDRYVMKPRQYLKRFEKLNLFSIEIITTRQKPRGTLISRVACGRNTKLQQATGGNHKSVCSFSASDGCPPRIGFREVWSLMRHLFERISPVIYPFVVLVHSVVVTSVKNTVPEDCVLQKAGPLDDEGAEFLHHRVLLKASCFRRSHQIGKERRLTSFLGRPPQTDVFAICCLSLLSDRRRTG